MPELQQAVAEADPASTLERRRAADRERHHRRVSDRKAAGRCLRCGHGEPADGLTTCASCARKNRERERVRNGRLKAEGRPRRDIDKRRMADRERYRQAAEDRAARGVCRRCGKREPAPERSLCSRCGEKVRSMARARYHKNRSAGRRYGGRPAESRRRSARIRSERRRKEWTEAGLCTRCGSREPVEGGTTCAPCRARRQARERERYAGLKAAGICVKCAATPTFDGAALCLACSAVEAASGRMDRKNAASRERYRALRDRNRCTPCGAPSHGASRCPPCAERSYTRSAHFRGIPRWDPEFTVVDLATMEEHGPFASRADADACAAFLKLPPGGFEVIAENHPLASVGRA